MYRTSATARSSILGIMLGGLVVGFSLVLIAPPQDGLASPVPTPATTLFPRAWWPEQLEILPQATQTSQLAWKLPADELKYQQRRQYLVGQAVVLPITSLDLSEVQIGDQLQLTASTNGRYHYTVLEVRTASPAELELLAESSAQVLLLTQPASWPSSEYLVVVAKPPSR